MDFTTQERKVNAAFNKAKVVVFAGGAIKRLRPPGEVLSGLTSRSLKHREGHFAREVPDCYWGTAPQQQVHGPDTVQPNMG